MDPDSINKILDQVNQEPVQSFTPLPDNMVTGASSKKKSRKPIYFGIIIILLLILGAIIFQVIQTTLTQRQTTKTEAAKYPPGHPCDDDKINPNQYCADPNPGELTCGSSAPCTVDPRCGGPEGCTAPCEGYCKQKGPCWECRFSNTNALKMICPCEQPTSPPPTSPPQPTPTTPVPTSTPKPTATPAPSSTPMPSVSVCPVPGNIANVEVICPVCTSD